ncbi:MAG: TorF family putative porin, partial [Paracoccaceae bacterium]|nr:TorF family putative porin [Paracoccaceae bacterium]
AQDVTVSGGLSLTSRYISDGLTNSADNPALQGYVELEASGFYAGAWASNVDGFGEDSELDLYFGYRGEFGQGISYDIGYARYLYDNSGDCCGEIILSMGVPLMGDTVTLTPSIAYDPQSEISDTSLTVDYALSDKIGIAGSYGKVSSSHIYNSIGASYGLTDKSTVDLTYHNSNIEKGRLVLSLSYDTTLFSR